MTGKKYCTFSSFYIFFFFFHNIQEKNKNGNDTFPILAIKNGIYNNNLHLVQKKFEASAMRGSLNFKNLTTNRWRGFFQIKPKQWLLLLSSVSLLAQGVTGGGFNSKKLYNWGRLSQGDLFAIFLIPIQCWVARMDSHWVQISNILCLF